MSDTILAELPKPKKTALIRFALAAQCFLLRRNWAGKMGDFVLVLVHRGRRTGRSYETPIAYLADGSDLLAISNGKDHANWYLNVTHAGEAELVLHGVSRRVRVAAISERAEIERVFEQFRERYQGFERAFRVKRDAPRALLDAARDRMVYLRFTPV